MTSSPARPAVRSNARLGRSARNLTLLLAGAAAVTAPRSRAQVPSPAAPSFAAPSLAAPVSAGKQLLDVVHLPFSKTPPTQAVLTDRDARGVNVFLPEYAASASRQRENGKWVTLVQIAHPSPRGGYDRTAAWRYAGGKAERMYDNGTQTADLRFLPTADAGAVKVVADQLANLQTSRSRDIPTELINAVGTLSGQLAVLPHETSSLKAAAPPQLRP